MPIEIPQPLQGPDWNQPDTRWVKPPVGYVTVNLADPGDDFTLESVITRVPSQRSPNLWVLSAPFEDPSDTERPNEINRTLNEDEKITFSPHINTVSGVSRDSTGAFLGFCTIDVFRDVTNEYVGRTTSDASGNWSLVVGAQPGTFWVREYKDGIPDVAGTSNNGIMIDGAVSIAPVENIFTRQGQSLALGIWPGQPTPINAQTWLGAPVDLMSKITDASSQANTLTDIAAAGAANAGATWTMYWTFEPIQTGGTLAAAAAGTYDTWYGQVADALLAAHNKATGPIIVRIGQEQNGNWFAWSAQTQANALLFVQMWQRIVDIFRAKSARWKFSWCPYMEVTGIDSRISYPGDAYVDIVAMDFYYNIADNSDQTAIWNFYKTTTYGLDWLVQFAADHDKDLETGEWGVDANAGAGEVDMSPYIRNVSAYLKTNNFRTATYWDADLNFTGRLSSNQYPLTGATFIAEFGLPTITSSATGTIAGFDAYSALLLASVPATWSLVSNTDGFTLTQAGQLGLIGQTYIAGGANTRTCTVRATDKRGLTVDQVFTLTVGPPVIDIWPNFDFAFDPIAGFYKIGTFKTTTLADFLARPEVHYSSDPTAAISGATGFTPTDSHLLYVDLPESNAWTILTESEIPVHSAGVYHQIVDICNIANEKTHVQIVRDAFTNPPRAARSGVQDNYNTIGTDTNFYNFPSSGTAKLAITISTSAIKFYGGGTLGHTNTTNLTATQQLGRLYIGDGEGTSVAWSVAIKRFLLKSLTDDALAAAWV